MVIGEWDIDLITGTCLAHRTRDWEQLTFEDGSPCRGTGDVHRGPKPRVELFHWDDSYNPAMDSDLPDAGATASILRLHLDSPHLPSALETHSGPVLSWLLPAGATSMVDAVVEARCLQGTPGRLKSYYA